MLSLGQMYWRLVDTLALGPVLNWFPNKLTGPCVGQVRAVVTEGSLVAESLDRSALARLEGSDLCCHSGLMAKEHQTCVCPRCTDTGLVLTFPRNERAGPGPTCVVVFGSGQCDWKPLFPASFSLRRSSPSEPSFRAKTSSKWTVLNCENQDSLVLSLTAY